MIADKAVHSSEKRQISRSVCAHSQTASAGAAGLGL